MRLRKRKPSLAPAEVKPYNCPVCGRKMEITAEGAFTVSLACQGNPGRPQNHMTALTLLTNPVKAGVVKAPKTKVKS
jgi:hypothetical protein